VILDGENAWEYYAGNGHPFLTALYTALEQRPSLRAVTFSEHLSEGDEVTFIGPYGQFRLSDGDAGMIWIAGGSGMAPFWSIIRHMNDRGIARHCTYYFGAVARRDLFLVDELNELAEQLDWFNFVPALSQPAEGDDWDGETGLITEVVDRNVSGGECKEAYLCGSGGMIDAAIKVLHEKDFPDERIYYDKFT